MTIKLGVVMDPIADISYKKDSTMAMLWAAAARGWELFYIEPQWLCLEQGQPVATVAPLDVFKDPTAWYRLGEQRSCYLDELDIILMRKDPPFDNQYVYATYILEAAEQRGTLVVNRCRSLRDCNEKVFATRFPQCCPPVLVSGDKTRLKDFPRRARRRHFQAPGRHGGRLDISRAQGRPEPQRHSGDPDRFRPQNHHGPALPP